MKSKIIDGIAFCMFWTGVIGLLLVLFASCNAVKQVNKSEAKQLKVITNYVKKHPAKNDTLLIIKPGDTVTMINERLDTLFFPELKTDTFSKPIYITKTITVTKTVKDTIQKTIIDRRLQQALQDAVNNSNILVMEMKVEIAELKHRLNVWKFRFFVLLGLNTLFVAWRIRKLLIV
jgi:hypothetical protein